MDVVDAIMQIVKDIMDLNSIPAATTELIITFVSGFLKMFVAIGQAFGNLIQLLGGLVA
ncbi:MAG: hypothetical protein FWE98_00065 [Oscillospiraceae bacterium]|nr:hypothetical protein [Oscillospiraceae bacterium]